jgi:hypothetical protein
MDKIDPLFDKAVKTLSARELLEFEMAYRIYESAPGVKGVVRTEILRNLFAKARGELLMELAERARIGDDEAAAYVEAQLSLLRIAKGVLRKR